MKKWLAALLVVMAAVPAFAAFQYEGSNYRGGYLTFDGLTNMTITAVGATKPMQDFGFYNISTGATYSMVTGGSAAFNSGDKIGFWIKDGDGNISASWAMSGAETEKMVVGYGQNSFNLYSGNIGPIYRYENVITVSEIAAPSGQPLPGALAALAIGGAVLVARKMRKKQA